MIQLHHTTTLLGAGLALAILILVRRDHLHLSHGAFWIIAAAGAALLGLWPNAIDWLAARFGIAYAPTLLLLVAVMVLLIRSLLGDIAQTRLERQLRRLNQRIALLEAQQEQAAEDPLNEGR